ncbi:MAG: di-trans,poly-cis-decaprenylcistransferase [Thaumarchaeota archaeon]|nr:MAG: di-trans,poly-cis-decaprenylcistransferase [Nitrososphaerota archaeon]
MPILEKLLKIFGIYKLYEKWLEESIKKGGIPTHIAVIMDGNRRWARKKGLYPWLGHRFGAEKVDELIEWCINLGIKVITIYALSTENLKRSKRELDEILRLLKEKSLEYVNDERLHKHGIRVKVIGRKDLLPRDVRDALEKLEEATSKYNNLYLNLAVAYGGRAEIVDASKNLIKDVLAGKVKVDEIDEAILERYLYTSDIPNHEPDMIIRTSGEERISNFLLWQSAYSELVFLDVYWPEFRKIDLMRAIRIYQKRQRRFGV